MGNVIFVLTVVGFWAVVFVLVVFLIRMSLGPHGEAQEASDTGDEQYQEHETTNNTAALT